MEVFLILLLRFQSKKKLDRVSGCWTQAWKNEYVGSAVKQHALNELAPDYLQRLSLKGAVIETGEFCCLLF